MSMKRLLLTTSVLALGLAGTAFAQSGAGSSAGAGSMGSNNGSPSYASPSTSGSGMNGSTSTRGSTMNSQDMNGGGANGGPMASGSTTGMGGTRASISSNAKSAGSSSNIRQAQEALQDQGLYHGRVDGKWGPKTRQAVAQFQKQKGLKQSAQLDEQTLNDLENSSTSGSDNSSSSMGSRSPNSSPSYNRSGIGATRGNGPATSQTNPGGANRSSTPTH